MISSYPVMEVLKTTSPISVSVAPKALPRHTEPSASTNRASAFIHGAGVSVLLSALTVADLDERTALT